MSSTLIELPPELNEADESSTVEYVDATSVEDFAHQTHIDDREVLQRVLLPGKQFGPYRILGFIASGGMGEIYAAERLGEYGRKLQPVALKVIAKDHVDDWRIVERFKREASISKAIDSPNVIRVYEYGETEGGNAFLAMELLAGEELFERLCRTYTLPLDQLVDLSLEILSGLADVHRTGFIHRDIKPENIFLARQTDGTEVAKILDFGIAKRRKEKSDPLLSVAGQIYGTPQYLAPEQAIDPDVDPRADIYSVGVLLYEAASGSLPFEGESSYDVIVKHQNDPVPRLPSSIEPEFAEIIYTALAKNPLDRFQKAEEMAQVIRRWRDEANWAEELPGEDMAFEEVFDTGDFDTDDARKTNPRPSPHESSDGRQNQKVPGFGVVQGRNSVGQSAKSGDQSKKRKPKTRHPRQPISDFERRETTVREENSPDESESGSRVEDKSSPEDEFLKNLADAPPSEDEQASVDEQAAEKARGEQEKAEKKGRKVDPTSRIARSDIDPEELKRESEKHEGEESKLASMVTWIAILAILAAIAYTVYTSYLG